jgi:hypothetical protein
VTDLPELWYDIIASLGQGAVHKRNILLRKGAENFSETEGQMKWME